MVVFIGAAIARTGLMLKVTRYRRAKKTIIKNNDGGSL